MSLETSRLRITGVNLVNSAYELQTERQTTMDNILFIPGIGGPLAELRGLAKWRFLNVPSLSRTMVGTSTFGTGVENILDQSGEINTATQASSGQRAAWGRVPKRGRVNLFERTNELTNAYWGGLNRTVSLGPMFQGNQMFLLRETINNGFHLFARSFTYTIGVEYTFSFVIKSDGRRFIGMGGGNAPWLVSASFDLQLGVVNAGPAAIQDLGDGFYRCSVTHTATATGASNTQIVMRNDSNESSYVGNVNLGYIIGMPQLEISAAATNVQQVVTPFDATEPGLQDCFFLQSDGSDDGYVTQSIDFTSGDKVTIFVALRRLSSAARGTVLELTPSIDSNNGAFHLTAPNAASSTFAFESKGTTLRDAVVTSALSDNARIITAIGDISGDLASIQVDNGTPTTNTGDQGSGNYSNAVLHLFRRGGSSLPANVECFGIGVAEGLVPAQNAARIRSIMSKFAPGVSL